MKVALLNDLPVAGTRSSGFGSGAELSSGRFLLEGHRRGHEVDALCPEFTNLQTLDEYDILVTKNLVKYNQDQLAAIATRKFIAWPSDYAWNRWRLYFGFQEKDLRKPETRAWESFFTKSLFNVFLSPLHRDCYEWAMPKLKDHPNHLSPPVVDVDLFKPSKDGWVPKTAAGTNVLLDFKALHSSLSWAEAHPDHQVTFIGGSRENVNLPKNAKFIGPVGPTKLAEILGRTETYIELPRTPQPFDRSAVEGFLACKRVEANGLVGAVSYDWFRSGDRGAARVAIRESLPKLWERIEKETSA